MRSSRRQRSRRPLPADYGLTKPVYSSVEGRHILNIGKTHFHKLINDGRLKVAKFGKKTVLYAVDLAAFMESARKQVRQPHPRVARLRRQRRQADPANPASVPADTEQQQNL